MNQVLDMPKRNRKFTPQPLYVLTSAALGEYDFAFIEGHNQVQIAVNSIYSHAKEGGHDLNQLHATFLDETGRLSHVPLISSVDGETTVDEESFAKLGLNKDAAPFRPEEKI